MVCAQCGAPVSDTAERCDHCGAALVQIESRAAGSRHVVTLTSVDRIGSDAQLSSVVRRCPRCGAVAEAANLATCPDCGAPLPALLDEAAADGAGSAGVADHTAAAAAAREELVHLVTAAGSGTPQQLRELVTANLDRIAAQVASGCPACGSLMVKVAVGEGRSRGLFRTSVQPTISLVCLHCGRARPLDVAASDRS